MYSRQDVSVARLSVGVDQLKNKNDSVCTAEDMKHQDDINVYGQTSDGQYVCTVCTAECNLDVWTVWGVTLLVDRQPIRMWMYMNVKPSANPSQE